jgi:hypothetical protein
VYVQANFKLESYKLNDVANHFLGEGKEDMYFGEITTKWKADSAQRREVGVYCLKDAELPLLLDSKLSIMINVVEACRTYGLSVDLVMFRGATIRCDRKFFGACIQNNTTNGSFFFVPFKEPSQNADKVNHAHANPTHRCILTCFCTLHKTGQVPRGHRARRQKRSARRDGRP